MIKKRFEERKWVYFSFPEFQIEFKRVVFFFDTIILLILIVDTILSFLWEK